MPAFSRLPIHGKIAALCGSRSINRTPMGTQKKAYFIRMFFKHKMLPIHEKAMHSRELVNIHLEIRGKALGISLLKINKSRLFATGAATLALEGGHEKRDSPLGTRDSFWFFVLSSPEQQVPSPSCL